MLKTVHKLYKIFQIKDEKSIFFLQDIETRPLDNLRCFKIFKYEVTKYICVKTKCLNKKLELICKAKSRSTLANSDTLA